MLIESPIGFSSILSIDISNRHLRAGSSRPLRVAVQALARLSRDGLVAPSAMPERRLKGGLYDVRGSSTRSSLGIEVADSQPGRSVGLQSTGDRSDIIRVEVTVLRTIQNVVD
ncbi:hypothetical protein LOC51_31100 [Rubrivivax sp. JA1024]|nr:hypothetical protein [Rubrivivax sp. JA1024]